MEILLEIFTVICICLLGGWFARMDGGGWPQTHPWIERLLCMSPFIITCAPFAGWWSLMAFAGVAGIATGHGQYFIKRTWEYLPNGVEYFDFTVRYFFGKDPRVVTTGQRDIVIMNYGYKKLYWRCVFGMFVTGTLVGLPAAILSLAFGQYALACALLLTGAVKSISYIASHRLTNRTEMAEWMNGFLRTALTLI